MVIFHSYVKLPEGMLLCHLTSWWVCICRGSGLASPMFRDQIRAQIDRTWGWLWYPPIRSLYIYNHLYVQDIPNVHGALKSDGAECSWQVIATGIVREFSMRMGVCYSRWMCLKLSIFEYTGVTPKWAFQIILLWAMILKQWHLGVPFVLTHQGQITRPVPSIWPTHHVCFGYP